MVVKKGDGLLMVLSDVAAEHDAEYNRWYNEEHIPERLSIPGVLNAARYKAVAGGPKYLACYELASADAWYAEDWQKWLKNPTAWSKRMSPSVIGTAYIRNLYRRIYPQNLDVETARADMSPVLLVGRMSVPAELDEMFNSAYNNERLPMCLSIPGYIRARRFEAVMGTPRYTTVHEMESVDVWKSPAWDDWRTAVTPVWNREIRPHMVHAEGSPGVYRRLFPE
ncbi:hypothetical protein NKDENANG_00852 [Candidatus Entotheonellaceae bacterium PAL068K]